MEHPQQLKKTKTFSLPLPRKQRTIPVKMLNSEDKYSRAMRVFRKLKSVRQRSSRTSKEANSMLFSDPSEGSSVDSWGNGSSISSTSNGLYLVTEFSETTSNADTVTDASSLPSPMEDFEDDSPNKWSSRTTNISKRSLAVYGRQSLPSSLPESAVSWLQDAEALVCSKEMRSLVSSSCDLVASAAIFGRNVAFTAGGIVIDVALLPVTIPLHVASSTTGVMVGIAGSVVNKVIGREQINEKQAKREDPMHNFIHNVFNIIPFVVNTVGSAAIQAVAPVLRIEQEGNRGSQVSNRRSTPERVCAASSEESNTERENLLDRLRLDFQAPAQKQGTTRDVSFSTATPSDISKFLLRVDDVVVMVSPDPAMTDSKPRKALFVDIGSEFADDSITRDALAKLIHRGLHVAATNVTAHLALPCHQSNSSIAISWKPEGNTGRLLRKMAQLERADLCQKFGSHVLVWSGKYNGPKYYGSDNPLFLARGLVRRNPRDFFDMLWDSDRTSEYNNFSLGRTDVLVIDDSISSTGDSGAKVIKSDTRVPFAGINITLSALMHGKKLMEGSEEGYIIVSRTLNCGMAGCHVGSSTRVEKDSKNEILLGVNIMRPVPGHPELTDLMSVSQVSSSMVPQFLAFRIGMMGLEDFFGNVRKH